MVNRPAGGDRSKRWEREPYDWYVDPPFCTQQLMERISFGDDLIYDPSCGRGTILDVAKARGFQTFGSDIIDRHPRHDFKRGDFLQLQQLPPLRGRGLSIINNPPYSYIEDIAEKFMRHAVELPINRAAFLVPIAFLCSASRWRLFHQDFNPSHIAILSERPSMPPGSQWYVGHDHKGGMQDYVWIVFTAPHRWRTQTIWLEPSSGDATRWA